jgi:hypothetical protein
MDFISSIGLFLILSGFVVGLGAVTVIDLHGFLGRKSSYWTEATVRTHKVTKPLIWLGLTLAVIGGFLFYRNVDLILIPVLHIIASVVLVLNGLFLSFWVSPILLEREKEGRASELLPGSMQNKIIVSLLVSDILWWGSLILLVVYISRLINAN